MKVATSKSGLSAARMRNSSVDPLGELQTAKITTFQIRNKAVHRTAFTLVVADPRLTTSPTPFALAPAVGDRYRWLETMKSTPIILSLLIGLFIGAAGGSFWVKSSARLAVLSGPYSDNYEPALRAIASAKAKLIAGDRDVIEELNEAEMNIQQAQKWSRRFQGQQSTGPNGGNAASLSSTESAVGQP